MKALIPLIFTLAIPCSDKQMAHPSRAEKNTKAEIAQQVSADYSRKAIAFIKQIKRNELGAVEYILLDTPVSLTNNDCLQELLADKKFYSPAELTMLKTQVYPSKIKWNTSEFPGVRLVMKDTVDAIFKVFARHWTYFHAHIGRDFNEFSLPIFLRNDTYCLFYAANYCGGLCGGGNLTLYKKEGNGWKAIKSYCEWIS